MSKTKKIILAFAILAIVTLLVIAAITGGSNKTVICPDCDKDGLVECGDCKGDTIIEGETDLDEDVRAAFENWYCDFYVSLDRELGENQIFLGGNYGSFGWVGFHNGDLTLPANEEIPLLGSVTSNPWTYADVEFNVGTFICGVGDVDDALDGATFTVKLRLTNPENEAEFYDVNVVTYTFGGNYSIK